MGVIKECGGKMWMGERQWSSPLPLVIDLRPFLDRAMEQSQRGLLRVVP